jgi:adenylate cyclase
MMDADTARRGPGSYRAGNWPMKLTLRFTLTAILLALTLFTVASLAYVSYRNARFTADDLSAQILDQNSQRIDSRVNSLLLTANAQGDLNRRLLESGQFDARDFRKLARYWLDVMAAHPRLTRLSLGLEDSGEWSYVRRRPDGRLAVGELRRNPATDKLELSDYWPEDYPRRPFRFDPDRTDEDPRRRPWYVAAREAGRQKWSETYVLFGTEGVADVPGVSCATPVHAPDGSLRGVVTSSFDLAELCGFLRDLAVGKSGYAFVVEFRADGTRRVIAHPDPAILLRPVPNAGEEGVRELTPPDELADQRVAAFLGRLPAGLRPAEAEGATHLTFEYRGVHYLGSYHCLTTRETPDWLVCVLMPEDNILERVWRSNLEAFWVGLAVLVTAVLVSLYVSRRVAGPLARLASETQAIGRLELHPRPVAHSPVLEVDRLAVAVEETKTSLRSFRKYVPAELVRLLLSSGQEAVLGGEMRRATVYFCDLADFTSVSESLAPEELVRHLADYFGAVSDGILASGGTVDKYIGDAIMAFWGAPAPTDDHAAAACVTALRNQTALRSLRERWRAEGKPPLSARIGLHTGEVIVGNIGSAVRLNYTVMGDAVNLASRLEGLNKYYGTEVLVSERTYREAQAVVRARPVDWVAVKGKAEAVQVYELLGLMDEPSKDAGELAGLAAQALGLYRDRDWEGAIRLFERILLLRPGDGPAGLLLARCRAYRDHPPGEQWDGVHRMEGK